MYPMGGASPALKPGSRYKARNPRASSPRADVCRLESPKCCAKAMRLVRLGKKRSPAPLYHAATRAVGKAFWEAYAMFVAAFREASERLRNGDRMAPNPRLRGTGIVLAWMEPARIPAGVDPKERPLCP